MTPLQKVAMGLVLTIADPSIGGYDAVPDVLGWVLVVMGLLGLRDRLPASPMVPLALTAGAVSLVLVRFDWLHGAPESTGWVLSLPQFAFSFVLSSRLAGVVGERLGRRFRGLRWAFVAAAAGPVLLFGGGVDLLLLPLAVLAVAANLYLVFLLFRAASQIHGPSGRRQQE